MYTRAYKDASFVRQQAGKIERGRRGSSHDKDAARDCRSVKGRRRVVPCKTPGDVRSQGEGLREEECPPHERGGCTSLKGTSTWKGIRVTVRLTIQNRAAKVDVVANATSLVIKELKEPLRDRKKTKNISHSSNLTKDQHIGLNRPTNSTG